MDKETCEVRKYTEFEKLRGKEVVAEQIASGRIIPVKTGNMNRAPRRMAKGKTVYNGSMLTDKMKATRERRIAKQYTQLGILADVATANMRIEFPEEVANVPQS